MSIDSVKQKLKAHCGTNPQDMQLLLRDDRGQQLASMDDDQRLLGFYSPEDGCAVALQTQFARTRYCRDHLLLTEVICRYEVHIVDSNPLSASANGWLEDTSKVEKYVMSDTAYNDRDGTYRKYKEMRRKVGAIPQSPL